MVQVKRQDLTSQEPQRVVQIQILEGAAILMAVMHAPKHVNLMIYTDSTSCLHSFAKGLCRNDALMSIVKLFWRTSLRKDIVPLLCRVSSTMNPAD